MTRITQLDLRNPAFHAAQREICIIVKSLVPEIVLLTHDDCKHSYAERQGFLGHCFPWVKKFREHNL